MARRDHRRDREHDALVVGAGPAGLATSCELSRLGVSHIVLERGNQIGHTWANFYDSLVLHTARSLSALPGMAYAPGTPLFPTRVNFLAYLRHYTETFRLPVETGIEVAELRRADDVWIARTAQGSEIRARAVVVATGIASNPYVPEIPQRDRFGGRVLHSIEYRRPHPFKGQRVLVAGAGNSAAEISVELAHGGANVTLAVRTGASVLPRAIAGIPIQYLAVAAGSMPRTVQRVTAAMTSRIFARRRGSPVLPPASTMSCATAPLIGFQLVEALRAGAIRLRGGLAHFTNHGVRFSDGSEDLFDTVILATGYRASLGMLGGLIRRDDCGFGLRRDKVVSADQPDLYFVGHNYDIRGALFNIARDAGRAARLVKSTRRDSCRTSTGTPPRSSER